MRLLEPATPPRVAPPSPPPPPPAEAAADAGADSATPPAATEPPLPPVPCQITDFKNRGIHLDATVTPEQLLDTVRFLDAEGFSIDTVTGVDWIADNQMEVVYDFFHPTSPARIAVRTRVPRDNPVVPSIHTIFPGANWHERETHDFFGIRFSGHPDLSPLLLPEDCDYHPLRKDFTGAA